jgi:hypothetical protein
MMGAALASPAVFAANDRVQMGIIGVGIRGNQDYEAFMQNKDVVFVAACDVQKNRLSQFVQKGGGTAQEPLKAERDMDAKGILSVRQKKMFTWDGKQARPA